MAATATSVKTLSAVPKLPADSQRNALLLAAALVAAIKIIEYTLDPNVMVDYDSEGYILNGLGLGWIISFRSYVYGGLIRLFATPFRSLEAMVAVQTIMGGITAFLLAYVLIKYLRVRSWIAIFAAMAFAIDPLQVYYEHYIQTEATTQFAMALFLATGLKYLDDRRLLSLLELSFLGIVLVSLRVVYLPVVIAAAVVIPILAWIPARHRSLQLKPLAIAVLVSLGLTYVFANGYRHLTGWLDNGEPTFQYEAGLFLLGTVSPLVSASDIDNPQVAKGFEASTKLFDHDGEYRNRQLWDPGGLIWLIKRGYGPAADAAADKLAKKVILTRPFDFLKLGWQTYCGFWNLHRDLAGTIDWDRHVNAAKSSEAFALTASFADRPPAHSNPRTFSRRYLRRARLWYLFLLSSPIILAVALLSHRAGRRGIALLLSWACLLQAATCLGAPIVLLRYLHPFSFTSLAGAAVICDALARRLQEPAQVAHIR